MPSMKDFRVDSQLSRKTQANGFFVVVFLNRVSCCSLSQLPEC